MSSIFEEYQTITRESDEEAMRKISELVRKGFTKMCGYCQKPYKRVPEENYEDGHGGRDIEMCRCESDLLMPIERFFDLCYTIKNKPPLVIGGKDTIIVKEHNFAHCNCEKDGVKNRIHTGDAEEECGTGFRELYKSDNIAILHCKKSDNNIYVLKSTKEEKEQCIGEYNNCPIEW